MTQNPQSQLSVWASEFGRKRRGSLGLRGPRTWGLGEMTWQEVEGLGDKLSCPKFALGQPCCLNRTFADAQGLDWCFSCSFINFNLMSHMHFSITECPVVELTHLHITPSALPSLFPSQQMLPLPPPSSGLKNLRIALNSALILTPTSR